MVTTLPRLEADGVRSQLELYHALDLDRHMLGRALPVVNCNRCGATAHLGRQDARSKSLHADLEQLYQEFFDENGAGRIRLIYHESIDRLVQATGALDLYLACKKISPTEWAQSDNDIRLLLHAVLPDPGEVPAAKTLYTEAWRGLWRLVNLFQGARGLHVEFDGLDTLAPPDMLDPVEHDELGAGAAAWEEARALCDEAFHSLIDALIAAETPGPDRIGDDLLAGGRVIGMMEFG